MNIDKPIFILAPARSGTTVFYNLFTRHKNTAFPEHFIDKHWESSFLMKFVPILVKIQQYRYKQRSLPHEGVFWRKYHDYNSIIDETNIIEEEKKFLHSMIKTQLKAFSANRFVDRSHDFCLRLKYLNALFPDAFYIILKRDPRAVVNSQYTMIKDEWDPVKHQDTYGAVINNFNSENKLETCINYYKFYIKTMNDNLKFIKNKIEIDYEDFVKNPRNELKKLYKFVGLDWYEELDNEIPEILELKNNEKWKQLPEDEQLMLEKAFN